MNTNKILASAIIMLATLSASAQNMYDAINISKTDYFGTARSLGVGNAVTAIGGDLGTIGINPAGSAVASYSQFVLTPGLTISSSISQYGPYGEYTLGAQTKASKGRFAFPNGGISITFDTGNRDGLRSFTMAFTVNETYNHNNYFESYGTNAYSSKMAELAAAATGMDENLLGMRSSYDGTNIPWDVLSAYQAGMFGSYGQEGVYAAISEVINPVTKLPYVGGELAQTALVSKYGSKNDIVLNTGLNFSDKFFVGINLAFPVANYCYQERFLEAAMNTNQFPLSYAEGETYFKNALFDYSYRSDMEGFYAKLGIIATPIKGLRLAAAIQTPTVYSVSEQWQNMSQAYFTDSKFNHKAAYSPEGEFEYTFISPFSANFGAAFTFGNFGFISADYELADYSGMRFRSIDRDHFGSNQFMDINETNRRFAGLSEAVRIGIELKPIPQVALRAGYGCIKSPERFWVNDEGKEVTADDFLKNFDDYSNRVLNLVTPYYYKDITTSFSAGIGYSSNGSFFADLALSCTSYPISNFSPYYDYECMDSESQIMNISSPKVQTVSKLWRAALTFGWRF